MGLPVVHLYGLERLLFDHGVDLAIWAHAHSYERFYPLYDYQIRNGTSDDPYVEPGATVHFITGSAVSLQPGCCGYTVADFAHLQGCSERHSHWNPTRPNITAFRSSDYGYTRIVAHNHTHLELEQVSDDKVKRMREKVAALLVSFLSSLSGWRGH